ncbi:hypothetical protein SVIO_091350 [Streptomyces violaceusniger]|uniref:Uncharacterized protein n=1 Tax=Streptomyces violaceusniger TaxID=68280 RepID=A0A4D4LB84_STRVO|nr:hypothetical protein SVIO_091350 [Streptomyces violaceusniger]
MIYESPTPDGARGQLDEALEAVERHHGALHKQLTDERHVSPAPPPSWAPC